MSTQQPTDVPDIEDWNRLLEGRVAVSPAVAMALGERSRGSSLLKVRPWK